MGSRSSWSASFGACLLGAFIVHASVLAYPVRAQHADAGAPAQAFAPQAPAEQSAPTEKSPAQVAGVLPKTINPALLSEGTRARLQERVAGRHASALPPQVQQEPTSAVASPAAASQHALSEPLRRGQARTRVQALETDEGITILSNRLQPESASRLASLVAQQPAPALARSENEDMAPAPVAADGTQTHSLRPLSARGVKGKGAGLGWLLWPFALFVTSGAVVGALWFRRRTE